MLVRRGLLAVVLVCAGAAGGTEPAATATGQAETPATTTTSTTTETTETTTETEPPAVARFGLTISGGVSLGAYEAGVNWSLVRLMKRFRHGGLKKELSGTLGLSASQLPGPDRTELVSATGASAGNINAFLTAAAWCQKDGDPVLGKPESSTNNPFIHLWRDVGFAKLFPQQSCAEYRENAIPVQCRDSAASPECAAVHLACATPDRAYAADDGLFTRSAFAASIYDIERYFDESSFPDCNFPLGVTLTRVVPRDAALEGVAIPVQRNAVALRARSAGEHGLRFALHEAYLPAADQMTGTVSTPAGEIFIPKSSPDGSLSIAEVIRIVQAASAFPVAFGPVDLESRDGTTAAFLDGGVFDNIPLGLLIELQQRDHHDDASEIYLQPMNMRATPERVALKAPGVATDGLSQQVAFLGGAVRVALNYELAFVQRERMGAVRKGETPPFPVLVTSRFSQIFGAQLAYFGAFMARDLRMHDYYVGIFDGLYSSSYEICSRALFPTRTSFEASQSAGAQLLRVCAANVLPAARDAVLTSKDDVDARYAVNRLLCSEFFPREGRGALEAMQDWAGAATPKGVEEACRATGRVLDGKHERWTRVRGVSDVLQALMDVNAEILGEQAAALDAIDPVLARWLPDHAFDLQLLASLLESDGTCERAVAGCTVQNAQVLRSSLVLASATLQNIQANMFAQMMGKLEKFGAKAWFEACRDDHHGTRSMWDRAECSDMVDLANDYPGFWARFSREAMFRLETSEWSISNRRKVTVGPLMPHGLVAAADFGLRTLDQTTGTASRRDGYWKSTSTASQSTLPGRLAAFALPSYFGLDVGILGVEAGYRPFALRPTSWLSMSPGIDVGVRARPGLDADVAPTMSVQLREGLLSFELGWRPFLAWRDARWLASPVGAEVAVLVLDKLRLGARFSDPGSIAPILGLQRRGAEVSIDDFTVYLALSDVGGIVYWLPSIFLE